MSRRTVFGLVVACFSCAAGSSSLAKGPTLTSLFPPGAARGQSLAVRASGTFDRWPVKVWIDKEGVTVEPGKEKGSLDVRVDPDTEPGLRWIRLYDETGATELRPFLVGTLPELTEIEPNDDPGNPQTISAASVTINGRLAKPGDVDGFAVRLGRGEILTVHVEANRHLGSPMDAVLQIASKSGSVLAQNDDTVGRDPRIEFQAPSDGTYLIRLFAFPATPDSSIRFAGDESFVYRLTLTTGGFLDFAFPLAVAREAPETVAAVGPNIPSSARLLPVPTSDGQDVRPVWHPLLAGSADVRVVNGPTAVESEPNDGEHPQEIPDRVAISGRIDRPGDRDAFRLTLRAGQRRVVRVDSRALGLPLDAVLRVTDPKGKVIAEADDVGEARDPVLTFSAPADGDYRILIRDLNDGGGPRHAYLLRVGAPEPDFRLKLDADRFETSPGKTVELGVSLDRQEGFSGSIELVAEGLPDGVTAVPILSKPGDATAKKVKISLSADGCAHHGPFRIVGRTTDAPMIRAAVAPIGSLSATTDRPWLTIGPTTAKSP